MRPTPAAHRRWVLLTGTLALILSGARAPSSAILVVDELPHVALPAGSRAAVIGRYQSCVGRTLSLENSNLTFEVNDDSVLSALRDPELRKRLLLFQIEVSRTSEAMLTVASVEIAPDPLTLVQEWQETPQELPLDRRSIRAGWAVRVGREIDNAELLRRGQALLLEALKERANDPTGEHRVLSWLSVGQAHLHDMAEWQAFLLQFADRWGTEARIAKQLEAHGLIRSHDGWQPETEFLSDIGMVRVGERVVTRERQLLEQEIGNWKPTEQDITLLRGYTQAQYEMFARMRQIHRGMERKELVATWGYPDEVSWLRRQDLLFEAWLYPRGWVCLVQGRVFRWQEDGKVKGLGTD